MSWLLWSHEPIHSLYGHENMEDDGRNGTEEKGEGGRRAENKGLCRALTAEERNDSPTHTPGGVLVFIACVSVDFE